MMDLLFLENYKFYISINAKVNEKPKPKNADSSQKKKEVIYYSVQISNDFFGIWRLREKRYSDFLSFRQKIETIAAIKRIKLPQFPPKTILSARNSVVQSRIKHLTAYLQAIVDSELVMNNDVIQFLLLPTTKETPTIRDLGFFI